MIQISFDKKGNGSAVCVGMGENVCFELNNLPFENRSCLFEEDALLFDGYSIWFEGSGEALKWEGDFSMTFLFAPLGYSSRGDGLFSLFDREKKEGFYVLLERHGKLQVGFGDGRTVFSFSSLNVGALKNTFNIVTVVFHKEAGWCDLCVNGVFANRKQFPRHMQIKWPEEQAFLGKYMDHENPWSVMQGSFYGFLKEVRAEERALSAAEVEELHREYPMKQIRCILPDRKNYEKDVQRPVYHLIQPGKWMNEPHGPVYHRGFYHIFYQANPHAPIWDNIQWGHVVSRDMVHWEDMPLALETGEGDLDPDGCWSGSSLVDKEGKVRIFYTAGNDGKFPNQFVAMAEADSGEDMRLPRWKKHDSPIVEQKEGWLGEFRDPFVWLEGETYFMLVGTGDENNGGGNAILYSSEDLLNWQSHGFFLEYDYEKNQEVGHVFELPVLLPLRDESGKVACHIFLFCACQIEGAMVETCAFLGRWDAEKRAFQKFHEKALLIDLGHGTFTGPSGFVTPDKRTVVFTIAQGRRDGRDTFFSGWAHNGGLPLELSIRNEELSITPIRELYSLKKKKLLHLHNVSLEEAEDALEQFKGNCFWLRVSAEAEYLALRTAGGDLERTVYYDRMQRRLGAIDEDGKEMGKYRGKEDDVKIEGEPVSMEYFLDHSMIEVYINKKKSITLRNYIQGKERQIHLSGRASIIRELELWEMDSAYVTVQTS